jgi:hypothetical protein
MDAKHSFSLGDHEPCEVFGEVSPLAFVGEQITVLGQSVLNDLGKLDDSWHERMLRTPIAPDENWPKLPPDPLFLQSRWRVCKTLDLTFKQPEIVLLESLWFFLTLPTLNNLSAFPEPSPAHSK